VSACILSSGRLSDLKLSFEIYEEFAARLHGTHASLSVFNSLLRVCSVYGRLDAAKATLDHAITCGIVPDDQV
jgi:pentatricopeptide repeat protein